MPATAPDPGAYDTYERSTMAHAATHQSPSHGSFGGRSARDLPWNRGDFYGDASENCAPLRSSFGSASARGAPSAAFAASAKDRFAAPKDSTPGPGAYAPGRAPLSPSNRLNRSSSFGGRTKRFGSFKDAETPPPGAFEAKPGAFDAAARKPRSTNSSGFGSRSQRRSPFGGPTSDATAAPAPGQYDAYSTTGAFRAASPTPTRPGSGSAAFASRSSRFDRPGSAQVAEGPDPTAYNTATYGSMASAAKTFNRTAKSGGGSFGTSTRRPEHAAGTPRELTPGPGQYDENRSNSVGGRRGGSPARPSSAFASKTPMHDSYVRKMADVAPSGNEYEPHRDGIATTATKSFNKHAGTGKFGPRATRPLDSTRHADGSPAPGSYSGADPTRPSMHAAANSARDSKAATAFGGTAMRDTSNWTGANRE